MRIGFASVLALALLGSTRAAAQWDVTGYPSVELPLPVVRAQQPAQPARGPAETSYLFDEPMFRTTPAFVNGADGLVDPDPIPPRSVPRLVWFSADYLLWWVSRSHSVPMIQTLPDSLATASTFPAGSASTLFPTNSQIRYSAFSGVRINTGFWFDSTQRFGLDASGFVVTNNSTGAAFTSSGSPILARFYHNVNNGLPTALQFSNSDPATGYAGSLAANNSITSLYGADLNFRFQGYSVFSTNTDWLVGFRYFDMAEQVDINGNANLRDGTFLNVSDHFGATNRFYGGQFGLRSRWVGYYGVSFDATFKLAIGGVNQRAAISGSNTLSPPVGFTTTEATGLYAQPSNIGTHTRNRIAMLPELTTNLNYNITQSAAVFVGYNMLYITNVLRANRLIDSNINDSNIRYIGNPTTGPNNGPNLVLRGSDFWMQGLNVGFRLEY